MKTEEALFRVIGMYCTTCKPIIENWLKDEKGVKTISIDFMTDSIVVEFNPSLVTRQEIKNKLDKSGYNLSVWLTDTLDYKASMLSFVLASFRFT